MKLTKNKLRVVHIPQVPMKGFIVEVKSEREAYLISDTLASQHLWLFKQNVIPDYSNMISIEVWDDNLEPDEDGEKWTDYYNDDEFMDWDEFTEAYNDYVNGLTL